MKTVAEHTFIVVHILARKKHRQALFYDIYTMLFKII